MVQHTGADDQIEAPLHCTHSLDRAVHGLEVGQSVLLSQLLRVFEARRADVDADNVRLRPAESVLRRLPCAAAGDQNMEIGAIRRVGPEQVMLGPMTIGILPFLSRPIEVGDGWRIWVPGVEVGYR